MGNAVGGTELNWDPAGFMEGKSELEVNRYRECELTHGRVGMLASLGFLVQEKFHPLFSADGGPAIDQIPGLPVWLWGVMGVGITAAESYRRGAPRTVCPTSRRAPSSDSLGCMQHSFVATIIANRACQCGLAQGCVAGSHRNVALLQSV